MLFTLFNCILWIGKTVITNWDILILSVTSQGISQGIGYIVHEIAHALGSFHEHMRPDRNKHIKFTDNKPPLNNVDYGIQYGALTYNITYDYGSIMHYDHWVRIYLVL